MHSKAMAEGRKCNGCLFMVSKFGFALRGNTENPVVSRMIFAAWSLMKYDFILRSVTVEFNQPRVAPSSLVNFTNFMEGVLLLVSTDFAPGSIYGSILFVRCSCQYMPVWAR
jgi:hypothetical protein